MYINFNKTFEKKKKIYIITLLKEIKDIGVRFHFTICKIQMLAIIPLKV